MRNQNQNRKNLIPTLLKMM